MERRRREPPELSRWLKVLNDLQGYRRGGCRRIRKGPFELANRLSGFALVVTAPSGVNGRHFHRAETAGFEDSRPCVWCDEHAGQSS